MPVDLAPLPPSPALLTIPDGLTRWFAIDGTIQTTTVARFAFDCHWPHDTAHGATPGDLAVIADGGAATLDLSLTGAFMADVGLDARGWLRLRLFKRAGSAPGFGCESRVRAAPLPASPAHSPEQLALAILGVHDGQWLESLARLAKANPGRLQARFGAAAPACLDLWRSLGGRSASILWSTVSSRLPGDPEMAAALVGLRRYAHDRLGFARVQWALSMPGAFDFLDEWLRERLNDFFGSLESDADLARALHKLRWILELARSLDARALTALEKRYSAELACLYTRAQTGDALLDCSFDFSAQGLSAYQAAIRGDFSFPPSPHVHRHRALLTHGLSRLDHLELHFPFLGRKQWRRRSDALARVEIETGEDGRLFVYPAETSGRVDRKSQYQGRLMLLGTLPTGDDTRFSLTFTDRRGHSLAQARLSLAPLLRAYGFDSVGQDLWPPAGLQSSLTVSLPGALAQAWLRAPQERASDF